MLLDPWRPIAHGRYLGTDPSKRFPIYTRGNAGEVFPEVQFPLSFTSSWTAFQLAGERSVLFSGLFRPKEMAGDPAAFGATFGGYTYLNLSAFRVAAIRAPGTKVADMDQQFLGTSSAPSYAAMKGDRNVRCSVAALVYGLRTLKATSLPQLDADAKRAQEWLAGLPEPATATDRQLIDAAAESTAFGGELFEHHLIVSAQAGVPVGLLAQTCQKKLKDPSMVARLLVGAGEIASAAPSGGLWDLGRLVAASPELTGLFDAGVSGLELRLAAEPAAAEFCTAFAAFLRVHGSRGRNEWETACPTWGTNPEIALALVDRMRLAAPNHDPRARHRTLVAGRDAAIREAAAVLGKRRTKRLRKLVASAALYSQGRERAKTTVVDVIHGGRLMQRELGRRCAARSGGQPDDLWFVTIDELEGYVASPGSYTATIAERRAMRDLLASREPPFIVNGSVPPFETWARRDENTAVGVRAGEVLTGIAGCPGVARGRARVILDPSDPSALGPGDVLVAPITDPAWTPLFVPAEAVVVDVGAILSHAVIVSRELGIPAVVSVGDATKRIPDGALIEVDGTNGTVTILELP